MPPSPRKILAIKFRSLGDTILLTVALRELARLYPEAEIHVCVPRQWLGVIEGLPFVTKCIPYEERPEPAARAKSVASLILKLRREKYDIVVNFHASPSSAMTAFGTGCKVRSVHYHGASHRNKYSTVEIPGKGVVKSIIERDLDTIRGLGHTIEQAGPPEVRIDPGEIQRAEFWRQERGLNGPFLVLGLGASRPTKIWPIERFAALALGWVERTGGSVLAVAAPKESALVQFFSDHVQAAIQNHSSDAPLQKSLSKRIQSCTDLQIRHLAAVMKTGNGFCGNDSGPKHLAAAVGIPTLTVMGPEHPFEWHPYPEPRHKAFFIENLNCRNDAAPGAPPRCGVEVCTEFNHRCMRDILLPTVLNHVLTWTKQPS
jgi:heptosyltransferase-3